MTREAVNYSLYLVTDSTPAILGDRDICHVVEEALKGGVTIVQYRDKTSDTRVLVSAAKRLHAVAKKYKVPLIINDRVDIALAIGCEGVHIGQDDIDLEAARRLLGPDAIIGVTVSTEEEGLKAIEGGANYLGVGTVFPTATKKDSKKILGPGGVRQILQSLSSATRLRPGVVCIGGIGPTNVQLVLLQASPADYPLDGVAVVSAVMGARDPQEAARHLAALIATPIYPLRSEKISDVRMLTEKIPLLVKNVEMKRPITHNMTNLVVQNFAANVALAVGASPIMSSHASEASDLAKLGGALVINSGTVTSESLENYVEAIQAYNAAKRPVVLDPVGAGATGLRRAALRTLLNAGYFTVIKGNEAEIVEVAHARDPNSSQPVQQHGVDSSWGTRGPSELATLVLKLAKQEKCVIVMTGPTDYISDGTTTLLVKNGHENLGRVTGTGCVLGTTISSYLASMGDTESVIGSVLAAMLHFEVAAEIAVAKAMPPGPGSFAVSLLDMLSCVRMTPTFIVDSARVEVWTEKDLIVGK